MPRDPSQCPIALDDRKGSAELLALFPPGLAALVRLPSGDFEIATDHGPSGPGLIGIERKAIRDLLGSMRDGRLADQLRAMTERFSVSVLIVEGRYRPGADGILEGPGPRSSYWSPIKCGTVRYQYAELAQFLMTIRMQSGVRVIGTEDKGSTVRAVMDIAHWFRKPWDRHKSLHGFRDESHAITQTHRPGLVARMAFQLQGIGAERARDIGRRFATPVEFMYATDEELRSIPGLGKVLAASARAQLWKKGPGKQGT